MNQRLDIAPPPRERASPWSKPALAGRRSTLPPARGESAPSGIANPELALDRVLDAIDANGLTPIELRLLLWLSERDATASELADAIEREASVIGPALRRLDMRGLVRRRFQGGSEPRLHYGISVLGLSTLRPLVQRVADTGPPGTALLWKS